MGEEVEVRSDVESGILRLERRDEVGSETAFPNEVSSVTG